MEDSKNLGELTYEIQFPIAEAILFDAQQWGIEIMLYQFPTCGGLKISDAI